MLLIACSIVSSSLVVSVIVSISSCAVRIFVGCPCLLSPWSGWVRSRRGRRIGVGEFVDVPFPQLFVHCDVEPVAEFSVRVLTCLLMSARGGRWWRDRRSSEEYVEMS